jgi:RDD family protein
MQYIVLGKDNAEYGPVDAETLQKWVEHGRVFKDTKIRNSLMKKWNEAGSMDFLQEAFSIQDINEEENEGAGNRVMGMFGFSSKKHEQKVEDQKNTAFRLKYIPSPANALQRIAAFFVDALLISVYGLILFFTMVIITGTWVHVDTNVSGDLTTLMEDASSSETDENLDVDTEEESTNEISSTTAEPSSAAQEGEEAFVAEPVEFPPAESMHKTFYVFFAVFVATILIYYGISLGLYAQTIGMWFWGIIIVKGYDEEVFPARGFAFTLLMFLIGPLAPLVVFINPQHRSIHGYLTGTRLIKITAHAKA